MVSVASGSLDTYSCDLKTNGEITMRTKANDSIKNRVLAFFLFTETFTIVDKYYKFNALTKKRVIY